MPKTLRYHHIIFTCLLIGGLYSCKTTQQLSDEITQTQINDDFSLSLERTACYGRCPTYKLSVDAKGYVIYEGKRFVENVGAFHKKITKDQVRALIHALESADFWSMKDSYDEDGVTDLPSVITYCRHKGLEKRVINRTGAPKAMDELEKQIDTIIGEKGYKIRKIAK